MKTKKILIIVSFLAAIIILADHASPAQSASPNLALIWTADSYTPFDYPGKALPTSGSRVKIVAAPLDKTIDSRKLCYRWFLDERVLGINSGVGQDNITLLVNKSAGDSYLVKLQILELSSVQTANEQVLATYSVAIPIVKAEALIFQKNDYLPVESQTAVKPGNEISLMAYPLFFSAKQISELDLAWQLEDQKISETGQKNPDLLTLKIPSAELTNSIIKNLSLLITKKSDSRQQASEEIRIEIAN